MDLIKIRVNAKTRNFEINNEFKPNFNSIQILVFSELVSRLMTFVDGPLKLQFHSNYIPKIYILHNADLTKLYEKKFAYQHSPNFANINFHTLLNKFQLD